MNRKTETTDFDLRNVDAFMSGDIEGFKQVYAKYRQRVLTYCLYFMHDRPLAEDAFQEVFTRIYTHRNQLRDPKALTTWVILVTRTVCLNMLRTSKFEPEFVSFELIGVEEPGHPTTFEDQSYASDATDGDIQNDILDDELLNALSKLPVLYRDAFLLCEFEGYTYDEIAKLTNTNAHNVQVRIARAKKMMREILAPSETYRSQIEAAKRKDERRAMARTVRAEALPSNTLLSPGS